MSTATSFATRPLRACSVEAKVEDEDAPADIAEPLEPLERLAGPVGL
jgi:hypothetical protein